MWYNDGTAMKSVCKVQQNVTNLHRYTHPTVSFFHKKKTNSQFSRFIVTTFSLKVQNVHFKILSSISEYVALNYLLRELFAGFSQCSLEE